MQNPRDEPGRRARRIDGRSGDRSRARSRLGVYELLGASFKTSNCLESTDAMVEERCAKLDAWKTSHQRQRWLATALLEVEPRLRRVKGHRHLSKLEAALG